MIYDFSALFKDDTEAILDEFLDKCTTCIEVDSEHSVSMSVFSNHYRAILNTFESNFEEEYILDLFEKVAKYESSFKTPYIVIMNELFSLKHILLAKIAQGGEHLYISQMLMLFKNISNRVAKVYLDEYIDLVLSLNNLRRISISDLVEKKTIRFYEDHLAWLTKLAQSIKEKNLDIFPELEATDCSFGKWLHNDGKNTIHNNSKYSAINTLHNNLHRFAQKIFMRMHTQEHDILITYLEKCELISLSIGTELAMIDNVLMNQQITKDSLTSALNRNSLKNIFESQYELSFATGNHFILAMCDLDFFKNINDTYGHVAGDKILINFVKIVKKNIRNSDIIIRYGGEEFIIILPAVDKEKGCQVLEKIRKDFQESKLHFEGKEIQATLSVGTMEIKPEYHYKKSFLDEYIMQVDQKLYLAKRNGRNRVESC
ncbi:diguanylate cyclase (GGDEF domain) [Sulfurimonas denitrificans DSM 1251]|uniref:diguanylate cyclase n=1 Tax=Sulfurimonas denitrificans (strain ATCC 33889 / DSM 1251) TaxID=326298 RepID=Q30P45_SULDN|nr:sensor domain-containing diguanylate cyclase [Sulfurimonas denitrificans]ABB45236.1 diguanylate cyclase (GGDEF domain) [Sulfurimonas denitrificans DSM 1251]MDD3442030.1 sensor domain-containing diguanylate cyclase [Sulfurimonas denitrificans]